MLPFAAGLFALVAFALFWKRADASHMQGMLMGGRISPGCVIAEAVVLVMIAIAILVLHQRGFFG
jgi:hypothetical protein